MMLERGVEVSHTTIYRWVIEYAATIKAIKTSPDYEGVKHRNSKYMNNIIEQDHRRIKKKSVLPVQKY